jgi:inhibitor of cysteine peptidase
VIRLGENATTGYVWSVWSVGAGLEVVGDERVPPGAGSGVGAGGERVFRVRAVAPGRGDVVLRLGREWEAAPAEEQRVSVTVRG